MSDQHFDPDQWSPTWVAKCAEIGADPLLRDFERGTIMAAVVKQVTDDPRDNPTIREAWDEWNRNTPESFWDVAVVPPRKPGGIEPSIVWPVSLDVANRFEIWAHGYAAALRVTE